MPLTTPEAGLATAATESSTWYRLVRRLATRPASEHLLVCVPDGARDRLAVLKRLPPALATDPAAVEKFRIEARIAAKLEHSAIVRVFEVVESSREDFYTMEYVRGADMRQLMDTLAEQNRTLPLDCVLLIAIQLCDALDHAHSLDIVHGELSPSKVLLGLDGTIKLTGFGAPPLRRSKPARRARTESVGYASPERFLGESTDARADLFALGVLLYELSSGLRLFADATTENQVVSRILRGDLPRPSEIRRAYPRELETIVMKSIARDRDRRYQTAAELQADLETFLWSRWPTASTSALAKLVEQTFPSDEASDLALGSSELPRIDPGPAEDPVLWLGPVPLAKPFPRPEPEPSRTSTNELRRQAPSKFPEASNVDLTLGAAGARSARAETDLALPVDHDLDVGDLGQRVIELVPKGQYQRPRALDEIDGAPPDEPPTTVLSKPVLAKVELQRVATPSGLVRAEIVRVKPPPPMEVAKQRLPSPPPSAMVAPRRRSALGTIVAILVVVLAGVLASAWAIQQNVYEPAPPPPVLVAQPSPPVSVVWKMQPKPEPARAAAPAAKKPRPHAAAKKAEPAVPAEPGSLDGLPSIRSITVKGIAEAPVQKAIEQLLSPLRGCYRAAARARQLTPEVELVLAFEVHGKGQPAKVRAVGGGPLDALAACAAKATSEIRDLPAPRRTARVHVALQFRPNP